MSRLHRLLPFGNFAGERVKQRVKMWGKFGDDGKKL